MADDAATATAAQVQAMAVTERVASCLSIAGILFILSTFLFSSEFKKPINRLVFFASWGNLGMNVASLISESGPMSGANSPLCQFQAFLIQMFLGVDSYWSLCMALNVYLVFFGRYDVSRLRRLDVRYLLACYGLALLPATAFIFVSAQDRGRVYGNAILWCWISSDWGFLRIALVYAIAWLAISLAFAVYSMAGWNVWNRREDLQGNLMNPFNESPLKGMVVTEIQITSEPRKKSFAEINELEEAHIFPDYNPYSVNIIVGAREGNNQSRPGLMQMSSLTRSAANAESNTEALLYARSAFFYFVALLIIWVPASINRAYAVAHPDNFNYPLNYISALLLSSQGSLNVIVYIVTSRTAVLGLWSGLMSRLSGSSYSTEIDGKRPSQGRVHRLRSVD